MKATVYRALLAHDIGKSWIKVVSLTGEATAINMVMAAENCPRCAIIKISEIKKRRRNRTKSAALL